MTDLAAKTDFRIFTEAVKGGGVVKAMRVPGGAERLTRKMTDAYSEFVKTFRAGGAPTVKLTAKGYETGIGKFLAPVGDEPDHPAGHPEHIFRFCRGTMIHRAH